MNMSTPTPYIFAATTLGIALSSCFAAGGLTLSYITVPSLLLPSPSTPQLLKPYTPALQLARQWRSVFLTGRAAGIPCALGSAVLFAYTAYYLPENLQTPTYLYGTASALCISVIPYTLIVMESTNAALMDRAAEGDAIEELNVDDVTEVGMPAAAGVQGMRTEDLLRRWALLNTTRSCISLLGILCVAVAAFQF